MSIATAIDLVGLLREHRLLEPEQLAELASLQHRFSEPRALTRELINRGWLTAYQGNQLLLGRVQDLVLGPYLLLERLGEGGMGVVYKARQTSMGRIVALKVIRKERLTSPDSVRRFQREIRAASQLVHPNVVYAYDAAEIDGTHFIAMEYVEGADLAKLVKDNGPLPVAQACDFIRQAALGLQHAHEKGMVHRDIKPHNLLVAGVRSQESGVRSQRAGPARLTADACPLTPVVKILDMGLARIARTEDGEASSTMTVEGAIMGTPDYIAPEQILDSHRVDIRADIYSLGCTLYFLLTGRAPFHGGSLGEKLVKHQLHDPQPVRELRPDVPPAVAAILEKMLAKYPDDRYATPAEVAAALANPPPAVETERTLSQSAPGVSRPHRPPSRSRDVSGDTPSAPGTEPVLGASGKSRPATTPPQPAPELSEWNLQPPPGQEPKGGKGRFLVAACGLALVATLCAIYLWPKDDPPPVVTPAPPPGPAPKPPDIEPVVIGPQFTLPLEVKNSVGMKFVLIPAGKFKMGSPDNEPGRDKNEGPVHDLVISRPFYLGIYEVTQKDYERVMGQVPALLPNERGGPNHPVVNVSWTNAVEFCRRLSALEDEGKARRIYRLPTEAEWEYACRAGSQTAYSFGSDPTKLDEFAVFKDNSRNTTAKVGSRAANAFGLYDMLGNVNEWCADWYAATYDNAEREDPQGPLMGTSRVIRGGNFAVPADSCRSANRNGYGPERWHATRGFRVVLAPEALQVVTNSIGMKLAPIPGGEFMMGHDRRGDPGIDAACEPPHKVRITKAYHFGIYEVTQAEFHYVMGKNPAVHVAPANTNLPVENVSYEEAVAFCEKLSKQPAEVAAGRKYRLPTEAEWEYACRAGTTTRYYFGDRASREHGNMEMRGGVFKADNKSVRVGAYPPNPWGLFDMHGNVMEMVSDWYAADYYRRSPPDDPKGPPEGTTRTARGGGHNTPPVGATSFARGMILNRGPQIGFRVVCEITKSGDLRPPLAPVKP